MQTMSIDIPALVGKYVVEMNRLRKLRQRARSKTYYYALLLRHFGSKIEHYKHIRGYMKWNKPGNKRKLLVLMKKYKIEQLQAEIEMHILSDKTRKDLYEVKKSLNYTLSGRYGNIRGLSINLDEHRSLQMDIKQLENLAINQDIEDIILRGKYADGHSGNTQEFKG